MPFRQILVRVQKLTEASVKNVDPQGRISIPAEWRRSWKSRKVVLTRHGNRIEVVPMETILPSSLFDSIKISKNVDFTDPHSLRKALLELTER